MVLIQKYFGKANRRRAYHFVLSFQKTMEDANFAKLVADRVAEFFLKPTKSIMVCMRTQIVCMYILQLMRSVMWMGENGIMVRKI